MHWGLFVFNSRTRCCYFVDNMENKKEKTKKDEKSAEFGDDE